MSQLKISVLLSLFICIGFSSFAQMDDKEKFREALYLMDENRFSSEEPLLREVYANDKENANINYCLCITIFKTFNENEKEGALLKKTTSDKTIQETFK